MNQQHPKVSLTFFALFSFFVFLSWSLFALLSALCGPLRIKQKPDNQETEAHPAMPDHDDDINLIAINSNKCQWPRPRPRPAGGEEKGRKWRDSCTRAGPSGRKSDSSKGQ